MRHLKKIKKIHLDSKNTSISINNNAKTTLWKASKNNSKQFQIIQTHTYTQKWSTICWVNLNELNHMEALLLFVDFVDFDPDLDVFKGFTASNLTMAAAAKATAWMLHEEHMASQGRITTI